jgi:hypothetical protein
MTFESRSNVGAALRPRDLARPRFTEQGDELDNFTTANKEAGLQSSWSERLLSMLAMFAISS